MNESPKPLWASKTFWTNIIGALALLAPQFNITVMNEAAQTQLVAGLLIVANLILRKVTKGPIK